MKHSSANTVFTLLHSKRQTHRHLLRPECVTDDISPLSAVFAASHPALKTCVACCLLQERHRGSSRTAALSDSCSCFYLQICIRKEKGMNGWVRRRGDRQCPGHTIFAETHTIIATCLTASKRRCGAASLSSIEIRFLEHRSALSQDESPPKSLAKRAARTNTARPSRLDSDRLDRHV